MISFNLFTFAGQRFLYFYRLKNTSSNAVVYTDFTERKGYEKLLPLTGAIKSIYSQQNKS